ncbi:MAG: ABC transporter permease [Candidatus Kaistia colombiensis]|nr:MAG: ABC transporter permease [Kaistia sp.]
MDIALYTLRRLGAAIFSTFALVALVFLITKLVPGDEAQVAAGRYASPEQVEAMRQKLGLTQPLIEQFFAYLARILQGDLGTSISTFQPVLTDLTTVIPATLELVVAAFLIDIAVAVPLAVLAAYRAGRPVDNALRVGAVLLNGIPAFGLALIAQHFLSEKLRLFPILGRLGDEFEVTRRTGMATIDSLLDGNVAAFSSAIGHLILPAIVLALPFAAITFRAMRVSLLAVMQSDFALVAKAKGVGLPRMVMRHLLPNASGPTVALLGIQIGWLFTVAILVENVFARSGIGTYLTQAVSQKDTFAVLGSVLFLGIIVTVANLAADLIIMITDPRIRSQHAGSADA